MRRVEVGQGRALYRVDRRIRKALIRAGYDLAYVASMSIAGAGAITLGLIYAGLI